MQLPAQRSLRGRQFVTQPAIVPAAAFRAGSADASLRSPWVMQQSCSPPVGGGVQRSSSLQGPAARHTAGALFSPRRSQPRQGEAHMITLPATPHMSYRPLASVSRKSAAVLAVPGPVPPPDADISEEQVGADLAAGACVRIGKHEFEVGEPIGEGSFGVVWGAKCSKYGDAAIKEIRCGSKRAAEDATSEGRILQMLGSTGPCERMPAFVDSCMEQLSPDEWRVRVVMTQVPGVALNRFLEQRVAEGLDGATPVQSQTLEACRFARDLVLQLSPAFARISNLAYHRDVNPRNILVEETEGGPQYSLIDFGLAVDSVDWRVGVWQLPGGESAVGAWQVRGVGGDCRYWPVSAWLMLEQGAKALLAQAHLCLEYKTHLDLHALGITAVQVLAELAPTQAQVEAEGGGEVICKLADVKAAWEAYWVDAVYFWSRLFEAYCRSGDRDELAEVKDEYRRTEVHQRIATRLQKLRAALQAASDACEAQPRELGAATLDLVAPLLRCLLAMVSAGEDSQRCSWRRVELLVSSSSDMPPDAVAAQEVAQVLVPAAGLAQAGLVMASAPPLRGASSVSTAAPSTSSPAPSDI